MVIDIGTGDGRAVLARAADEPRSLVIGIDADARSMAESSRRADRRGPANAIFLAAGAESLSASALVGVAALVTVRFPWGSLLRGVLGLDAASLAGVASVLGPGGSISVLASVVSSDRVAALDRLDAARQPAIRQRWAAGGFDRAAPSDRCGDSMVERRRSRLG